MCFNMQGLKSYDCYINNQTEYYLLAEVESE